MDALQVVAFQNASLHWPDWLKPVEDDGRYTEAVDQGLQIRMLQLGRTDVVVAKFGDGPYKAIFSIVSIIALALIVMGLRSVETIPMYDPPSWARTANYVGMFFAIYLVFSNSLGSAPSSAKVVTAHPMSWGVVFWSGGSLVGQRRPGTCSPVWGVSYLRSDQYFFWLPKETKTSSGQAPANRFRANTFSDCSAGIYRINLGAQVLHGHVARLVSFL